MTDNEINDVRRTRHKISADHDHDTKKLVAHYQKFEEELRRAVGFALPLTCETVTRKAKST